MNAPLQAQTKVSPPSPAVVSVVPTGLLQRQCACGGSPGVDGECAACRQKRLQRKADHSLAGGALQTKLAINKPGDEYEQEADRVAAQVMVAPGHSAIGGTPPRIQRYAGQATEGSDTAPASVDRVLASPGRPLEPALRQDMEQRLGHDFSRVRVHSSAAAEQSAREVNANAYTVGHNIVFDVGRFAPETYEGRRLFAHELTHVVQQSGSDEIGANQSNEKRGSSPISTARTTPLVAREDRDAVSSGSTVGYVAIYLGGEGEDSAYIDFHTNIGLFRYSLEEIGQLKPGEYQANVVVKGNTVDFTLDVASTELFGFGYRVDPGKPNPKTFFAHQSTVTFTVTAEAAPPIHKSDPSEEEKRDPNVVYLTVEEALRRCESGDLQGVKIFPYRGTRFGGAPLTVFRDGNDIVVKSYVTSVLGNKDFQKQTRTLPTETFIGGVRLKPNESSPRSHI